VVSFVCWDLDFRYGLKIKFKYCVVAWIIDMSLQVSDITGSHNSNAFGRYQVRVFVVVLRCFMAALGTLLQVP
jgi:hypothetical protein